ncbi:MAG: OmpH family outer membrane protein [Chloracidobacterium sp.]|nr:OmpH family outer membrane protein [Chloracidobacterium sp.]
MKKFSSLAHTILFAAAFASAAFAQTATQRIAVIDTKAFEAAGTGITKYTNALKSIETEFAPTKKELENISARIRSVDTEIKAGTEAAQRGRPVDSRAIEAKREEYERLKRDYRFKEEDARTRINRRVSNVTGPLDLAIGDPLIEYGKQNGYAIILDVSRDQIGLIVAIPDEKIDITKDFITFFNAKP